MIYHFYVNDFVSWEKANLLRHMIGPHPFFNKKVNDAYLISDTLQSLKKSFYLRILNIVRSSTQASTLSIEANKVSAQMRGEIFHASS